MATEGIHFMRLQLTPARKTDCDSREIAMGTRSMQHQEGRDTGGSAGHARQRPMGAAFPTLGDDSVLGVKTPREMCRSFRDAKLVL